jgi:hypothetical protein
MMPLRCSTKLLSSAVALAMAAGCKTPPSSAPAQERDAALPKDAVPLDSVVQIAAGDEETCVIRSSGALYCAGGVRLGMHPELTMARPVQEASRTRQISLGFGNSCAVQENGSVVCWGSNRNHIMPDGTQRDRSAVVPGLQSATYVLVPRGPHPVWVLRRDSSIPMLLGGSMLKDGFVAPHEAQGIRLAGSDVAQVEVGWELCARTTAGEVKCWDGSSFSEPSFEMKKPVDFLPKKVIDIAAAFLRQETNLNALCALGDDGRAVCWRYQMYPYPSDTPARDGPFPVPIDHPLEAANDWRDIAMSFDHSCGVKRDGSVWCAGRNDKGQLGTPQPRHSFALLRVPGVSSASAVAVGKDHSCALLANGTVVCWGGNGDGQCGTPQRSESVGPSIMLRHVGPGGT